MELKIISGSILLALVLVTVSASDANIGEAVSANDYAYNATCMTKLREHIQRELQASVTYLAMGAWANHYAVQRPGLAKFFFASASEERTHGLTMLNYLRMRGHNSNSILPADLAPQNDKYSWESPLSALRQALYMEKEVTRHIKGIIDYCADAEDHHLADYLTADFMEEQLQGQRTLAGYINTLRGLLKKNPAMANWTFDNKLNA